MFDTDDVQSQLDSMGIAGFAVTACAPVQRDPRDFFARRAKALRSRRPDAPLLKMLLPTLERLDSVPLTTTLFRWEAECDLGHIVGYSTSDGFIAVYPWVLRDREWTASLIWF